jgi:predicted nucleotidyltransferase/uncharacterized protein with HEPN domain
VRDDREHLLNVLEAAESIGRYLDSDAVAGVREAALTHLVSRLSGAVRQVSPEFRLMHPAVPWGEASNFGSRVAPGGVHTEADALDDVTRRRVPLVANAVREILLVPPPSGRTDTDGPQSVDRLERLQRRREQILGLAERRGIRNIRVFGSVARGEADDSSDLDLLVDLSPGHGLFALGGFAEELAALLGTRVDVATVAELKPRIRERVLAEAVAL